MMIVEPLKPVRVLPRPQRFVPLRGFTCGRKGSRSEKLINRWAREAFQGKRRNVGTVLVLEDADSNLVGISSFRPRALDTSGDRARADGSSGGNVSYYVHIIAVDGRYRGQRRQDGARLGDILLDATLEQIGQLQDGPMPQVWAIITPENAPAQALFGRNGFSRLGRINENELVYFRPPSTPIDGIGGKHTLTRRITSMFGRR